MRRRQSGTATSPKMTMPEIGSNLRRLVPLVTATCLFSGCDDLTRFEQERYECGYNPDGLVEIELRDFEKGAATTVTFTDETVTMPVIEISDERLTLGAPGLIIRIDRGSGIIRLTRGSRYRNVKCVKSKFRM
jgi:hypothetical protein